MKIAKFSVKNSVLVNLLMVGLFIFGSIALVVLPKELNPNINFNWVFVTVVYPGASPTEVENLIIDPMEAEIQDIDDISEIQSTAGESLGFLLVKFEDMSETAFREHYTDLKAEIDKVKLPEDAEEPIIDDFGSDDFLPIITINMSFNIPEDNAQYIADDIEEDLNDISGVAKVQVSGLAEREIWVEVDPEKLNSFGISIDQIVFALKARNLNVPGGTIAFGKTEYFIRSLGEYQNIFEIENTVINAPNPDKPQEFIRINDVANVSDRRKEMDILSRTNGDRSITFSVSKKGEANSLEVIDAVKALVETYRQQVPDGVDFSWTNDNSVYIMRVINILRNNAITGMILIFVVLFIFLGGSNALLASLGIPISFFITFVFLMIYGYSLNGNTLFALVMVLGIIVDDAIIVIENCHRYRLRGFDSFQSAIRGTSEVVSPILSSIGTNIAAFLPLILIGGIMGKFMRIIPIVFSLALLASLFEAFFLLPSHYADWTIKSKVYKRGEKKFFLVLRKAYGHLLIKVIRRRYWLIGGMLVVLLISFMMIPLVGVEMFPDEDFDQFTLLVKFPEGTSLDETNRIMEKFEKEAQGLPKEAVQEVVVNVGLYQGNEEWITRKNVAQIVFQLLPHEQREMSIDDLIAMMQKKVDRISGPISLEFQKVAGGPPQGKPISVKVQGRYMDEIKRAALALQDSINTIEGTLNITDNYPPGKQEIRIIVDEEKAFLYGFSTQNVSMNVRYAFDGIEATEYRDGDEEIDVIVKYGEDYRSKVDDVLNLKVTNPRGKTVALRDMVEFKIIPGPTEINRFDQKRTILVTGEINTEVLKLDKVNLKMIEWFPKLEEQFPGVTFEIGGAFEEFLNVFRDIIPLFVLSLIIIFVILGTQFNSYLQPLIILTTVPFSFIGAVLGLLISGNPFSIAAMYGIVALGGIVVNDAIVMIDFMNNRRAGKDTTLMQYWRSIINSGRLRLRPIILTSLTTISGLIPMAFGIGGISLMWSPLANVILFGLLISTVLTLFVIPSMMAVLDDILRLRKKALKRQTAELAG